MKNLQITLAATALFLVAGHMLAAQDPDAPQLSKRDQLRVAAQQICPVSGRKLSSMGTPVKTRIGKEEIFLCCKACASGKVSREHWGTLHANIKKAQGKCPVMGKPLPGKAKWAIVEGQIVYVCCPPCIEKIQAEPKKWLAHVDQFYATSATPLPDGLKIAAQGICPVSGKKLGSMGTPVKTKIGKEELFLCCKACGKGKVNREHWNTIHANFKKAQAICPIMGKPLPAKAQWTVVEGQIVYVCCPPCISKIEANASTNLARVAAQYAKSHPAASKRQ